MTLPCHAIARLVLCLVLAGLIVLPGAAAAKETHPIQGELHPDEVRAEPGERLTFDLEFTTRRDFGRCVVTFEVSKGLEAKSGDMTRVLEEFKKGVTYRQRITVEVMKPGEHKIHAIVRVLHLEEEQYSRVFIATINRIPKPEPRIRVDEQGRKRRVRTVPSR